MEAMSTSEQHTDPQIRHQQKQQLHAAKHEEHQHVRAQKAQQPIQLHIGHDELVIRQRYETASIANDVLIGIWFVIGTILFFGETTVLYGTWLFLVGSVQMLIRPVIRLTRRVHLGRISSAPHATARDF